MSYKNKIKDYKAKVDLEAWQGMESLLDDQAQIKESTSALGGFLTNIRRWILRIGIGLVFTVAIIYFFSSNRQLNSTLTEYLGKSYEKTEEEKEQNINSEIFTKDLVESETELKAESNDYGRSGLKTEISISAQVEFQGNTESTKIVSTDVVAKPNQAVKSTENISRNGSQSQKEFKAADNSIVKGHNDTNTIIQSNDAESLKLTQGEELMGGKETKTYGKENFTEPKIPLKTMADEANSKVLETNSNVISETVDKSSSVETKAADIVALLNIESIQYAQLGLLKSNQAALLGAPDFVMPPRILSRYLVGLDIGSIQYLQGVAGTSVSVFGVYEVYPWLRAGLRLNMSNMGEKTKYILSPNITRKKSESGLDIYTQIVPLRLWRFNLGIEGGFGTTFVQDKYRRSENPEPNIISIREEVFNYTSKWFYLGAHFTIDITPSFKIGTTVGANIGTESAHFSGRIVYRI